MWTVQRAGTPYFRFPAVKERRGNMDFISYTFVNAVISALAVFGCWLILRPQKIENRALHKSIDNNTKALEDLTGLINEMRVAQASVETNIYQSLAPVQRSEGRSGQNP
jgi:hypothetical protein